MRFSRRGGLSQEETPRESQATQVIVFLTAILTGSATLASQYTQLPWWYKYPLALFTLVSLVVLVNTFLWPVAKAAVAKKISRRQLNAASREIFSGFEDIVRRFQQFISAQNQETLPACLIDLRNQDSAWRARLPAMPQLLFISELFGPFSRRLREWDGTYEQFNDLAQQFLTFLHLYDSTYVWEPLNSIRGLKREDLPENLRNKINLRREDYTAFLRDYMNFAKRANARVGRNPFSDYMRLPEPI